MAIAAYHEGLSLHCCHNLYPEWFFPSPFLLEVFQSANVMDANIVLTSADFTRILKEPFDYFISWNDHRMWVDVLKDCLFLSSPRYAAKSCYKWLLLASLNPCFQTFHLPV